MRLRVSILLTLVALAVLFAWSAGQSVEMTIPDPDRYRDSSDGTYLALALFLGSIGALSALGALYVLARIVRGRRSWRLPFSAYVLIAVLLASALPYEGWIDSEGIFNSFGYVINALLIGVAIALTWLTVRSLKRERARHPRTVGLSDDPLDLIMVMVLLVVAAAYGANGNDSVGVGILALAGALLVGRAMRDYRRARRRRPQGFR